MCGFPLAWSSDWASTGWPAWAASFRFSGDIASKLSSCAEGLVTVGMV